MKIISTRLTPSGDFSTLVDIEMGDRDTAEQAITYLRFRSPADIRTRTAVISVQRAAIGRAVQILQLEAERLEALLEALLEGGG